MRHDFFSRFSNRLRAIFFYAKVEFFCFAEKVPLPWFWVCRVCSASPKTDNFAYFNSSFIFELDEISLVRRSLARVDKPNYT